MIIRHEKVKAGLIGWGENSMLLVELLTKYSKNIDLSALSTSNAKARDYAIRNLGIKHIFRDYKQMLDLHEIDAVILASDDASRTDQIRDCLQAGYHVLYELPAADSITEAISVVEAVEHYPSQIAMMSIPHRYDLHWIKIKKSIDLGELGRLLSINISIYDTQGDSLLMEAIDLVRWITGSEFGEVHGIKTGREGKQESKYLSYSSETQSGTIVHVTVNRTDNLPTGQSVQIVGEKKEINVHHPIHSSTQTLIAGGQVTPTPNAEHSLIAHQRILNAFLYNIQEKSKPSDTANDILSNTRTSIAFKEADL